MFVEELFISSIYEKTSTLHGININSGVFSCARVIDKHKTKIK